MTTAANPRNAVYNFAAGKRNTTNHITTLRKPDGTLTTHTIERLRLMQEQLHPGGQ